MKIKKFNEMNEGKYHSIENKKPKNDQEILYVGNHGLNTGVYRNYTDGVGWVFLPDGGVDAFEEWIPNDMITQVESKLVGSKYEIVPFRDYYTINYKGTNKLFFEVIDGEPLEDLLNDITHFINSSLYNLTKKTSTYPEKVKQSMEDAKNLLNLLK